MNTSTSAQTVFTPDDTSPSLFVVSFIGLLCTYESEFKTLGLDDIYNNVRFALGDEVSRLSLLELSQDSQK